VCVFFFFEAKVNPVPKTKSRKLVEESYKKKEEEDQMKIESVVGEKGKRRGQKRGEYFGWAV
jgi:hypothetical protein